MSEAWHHIENQWQLKMPYLHDDFYVEVYPLDVNFDQETSKVQLWIPIDHKSMNKNNPLSLGDNGLFCYIKLFSPFSMENTFFVFTFISMRTKVIALCLN